LNPPYGAKAAGGIPTGAPAPPRPGLPGPPGPPAPSSKFGD